MRLGVEVYSVLTVHFSNDRVGRGAARAVGWQRSGGRAGIDEREALAVDGVLTGYQGSAAIGEAVLETVALVRERNPEAVYCCDPVMGDVGRGFFDAGIPEMYRDRIVPQADIGPNQFELEFLTGRSATTLTSCWPRPTLRATGPDRPDHERDHR